MAGGPARLGGSFLSSGGSLLGLIVSASSRVSSVQVPNCESDGTADGNINVARGPACGGCPPDLLLIHPELSIILIYYSL